MRARNLIISVLTILIIGVVAIYFILEDQNKKEVQALYDKMAQDTVVVEEPKPEQKVVEEEPKVYVPPKDLNWEELHGQNPDVYAWIYVPDTNIDYPVLRHDSDDLYYLETNIDHTKGYPGCIYCEPTYNTRDFSQKCVVYYGHNMRDGSMFSSLHNFENKEFFEEERYIYIYDETGAEYAYEIFAAFPRDEYHPLDGYDLTNDGVYQIYLNDLEKRAKAGYLKEDIYPQVEDRILILSTCVGSDKSKRYLVAGINRS